jgi:hypothetical protein
LRSILDASVCLVHEIKGEIQKAQDASMFESIPDSNQAASTVKKQEDPEDSGSEQRIRGGLDSAPESGINGKEPTVAGDDSDKQGLNEELEAVVNSHCYPTTCEEKQIGFHTPSHVRELELIPDPSESSIGSRIRTLSQFLRNTKESGVAIAAQIAPLCKALIQLKKEETSGSDKMQALLHSLLLSNSAPLASNGKAESSVPIETVSMRRCTLRVLATALMPSNEASEELPLVLSDPLIALLPSILQCPRSVARECCTFLKVVCLRAGCTKVEALVAALVTALSEAKDRLTPEAVVNLVELVGSIVIACSQQHHASKNPPFSEIGGHVCAFVWTELSVVIACVQSLCTPHTFPNTSSM